MTRVTLTGMSGANPLGFMAAVGLLRLANQKSESAALGFLDDGSFQPFIEGVSVPIEELVAADASGAVGPQPWRLRYGKAEKKGEKFVEDLKPPPDQFKAFLTTVIADWIMGRIEGAEYAAAYATSTARDLSKGNTKPTAFHFTAANQQFLGAVELIRACVSLDWARESIFQGHAARAGVKVDGQKVGNVRWDPGADRNYALMAENPNETGTSVDAPLEWLAFRGLPLFPTLPIGNRVATTAVSGRGDEMKFGWPVWSPPASLGTVRSLLSLGWGDKVGNQRPRGVFAVCASAIRRTSQGFGNFGPASIST